MLMYYVHFNTHVQSLKSGKATDINNKEIWPIIIFIHMTLYITE